MPTSRTPLGPIQEPWLGFLRAVDKALKRPTEIHCIGGFALQLLLQASRPTGDVDFVQSVPDEAGVHLTEVAGRNTELAVEHKLYLNFVKVTEPPSGYATRLLDATPGDLKRLEIKVLDPYDLVLTKLERNSPRDREDVKALILELGLDADVLRTRFDDELRPYLAVAPDRTIMTFELWMDEFFPPESG
jgi:hypothetical protein